MFLGINDPNWQRIYSSTLQELDRKDTSESQQMITAAFNKYSSSYGIVIVLSFLSHLSSAPGSTVKKIDRG